MKLAIICAWGWEGPSFACQPIHAARPCSPVPQDLVCQLLVDISRRVPDFALSALMAEVVADLTNWDSTTIALRALLSMLHAAPTLDAPLLRDPALDVRCASPPLQITLVAL